jgi:hypothetical protein
MQNAEDVLFANNQHFVAFSSPTQGWVGVQVTLCPACNCQKQKKAH